ncbi:MAG: rhodanese-like domain-containing protein [Chloroflexi bacterium]|nr:rhodanese-like domain-containing protein [Chloroflexota bacterium]
MNNKRTLSLLLLIALLLVEACRSGAGDGAKPGYRSIEPEALHSMLAQEDFLLVNVHIPYEGRIPGTDTFIPYNEIDNNRNRLPADKGAKIAVYCMTGSMSEIATRRLVELGYTQVLDLKGGMLAWQRQGYPLEDWAR